MNLARHITAWAYQNAWANHRLLSACARLSPSDFVATRTSFFPSISATLNHIVTVDWLYVDAIERALDARPPHPRLAEFFEPEEPFNEVGPLATAQREVDRRLIAVCHRAAAVPACFEQRVGMLRRQGRVDEPLHRLLGHVFEHQIHHRGQAHAMLAGTSVAPPQLDEFFCESEAGLRAEAFAALGFTEAEIWG